MGQPSDKLFRCRWVRDKVPATVREELYHILRMTGPLLFSRILCYLPAFVITAFCGRLGNNVLAGYGLASAFINVTTAATGFGLGRACDTLVAQTFGGKNLLRVGVIMQQGAIILLLACLPCWALLINAEAILLSMGQNPEVARITQIYLIAFIPAVPAMFLYNLLVSYLQNQGIILPQLYTAAVANVANLLTNYTLLYWLDLGVSGSATANALSQYYICVSLFAYIWWKRLHVQTWGGWSVESLQEWGSFMKLAVPSTLMTCFEWWVYEFGGFFAGMLGEEQLAAQHTVMMVSFIIYMFPLGLQAAACARVGNALGAGDTARAILATKLSFALTCSALVIAGVVLASTKSVIGYMLTPDENIVKLVSYIMNVYMFLQFFDGIVCLCSGIFLGTGKQKIPAVANFVVYYCIGVSLSVVLIFVADLGILGFWLALLVSASIQSVFFVVVICKLDWKKMTEEAVERAHTKIHTPSLSAAAQSEPAGNGSGARTVTNGHSMDGYKCVTSDDHEENLETPVGHVTQDNRGGRLSIRQLLLRRGLILLAMVGLLAAGTVVRFVVPLPERLHTDGVNTTDWLNSTFSPEQLISTVSMPIEEAA